MPLLAAIMTFEAPLSLSSWARIRPVGPAPMMRTSMPTGEASLSKPWIAHAAGSTRVASSSVRLWILNTLLASLNWSLCEHQDEWEKNGRNVRTKRRILQIRLLEKHLGPWSSHIGAIGLDDSRNKYRTAKNQIRPQLSFRKGEHGYLFLTVTPGSATHLSPLSNPFTFLPTFAMEPTTSWPGTSYHISSKRSHAHALSQFAKSWRYSQEIQRWIHHRGHGCLFHIFLDDHPRTWGSYWDWLHSGTYHSMKLEHIEAFKWATC